MQARCLLFQGSRGGEVTRGEECREGTTLLRSELLIPAPRQKGRGQVPNVAVSREMLERVKFCYPP